MSSPPPPPRRPGPAWFLRCCAGPVQGGGVCVRPAVRGTRLPLTPVTEDKERLFLWLAVLANAPCSPAPAAEPRSNCSTHCEHLVGARSHARTFRTRPQRRPRRLAHCPAPVSLTRRGGSRGPVTVPNPSAHGGCPRRRSAPCPHSEFLSAWVPTAGLARVLRVCRPPFPSGLANATSLRPDRWHWLQTLKL